MPFPWRFAFFCHFFSSYFNKWHVLSSYHLWHTHVLETYVMFLTLRSVYYVYPLVLWLVGNRKHPARLSSTHLHIRVLCILCVWTTAWTISGTGTITIFTFNESLCGRVMVGWVMGYGTIRRHWFREEEGVTCYVNSLRYLSTDKLTQSDSVQLWSFALCFPMDPGTGPGRK